jgi:LysM repeat protein
MILTAAILLLTMAVVQAQIDCPALVEQALTALSTNCNNLERNTACYGYFRVEATFADVQPVGFFTLPADRAPLQSLRTIRTAPLDLNTQDWGVAVMNLQANIPDTLPGQAVTFVLMGDTSVTNAVGAAAAAPGGAFVNVTTAIVTDLRSSPGLTSNVVGTVQSGAALQADGLSADGQWVRVQSGDTLGWVNLGLLAPVEGLSSLPVVSAERLSPMQAFYFNTGVGRPSCEEAPSALAVKSPEGIKVDLTVNGADIQVGSFVTFKTGETNNTIMTVVEGQVVTEGGNVINGGETSEAQMDAEGNILSWNESRPATSEELILGDVASLVVQSAVPSTTLLTNDLSGPLYHIVQPGENLFRIALRYETSVMDIANANGITDLRRIFVGQQLLIPNPGSGFVNAPDAGLGGEPAATEAVQPAVLTNGVDCSRFVGTSPIGRLPWGPITFYWDPAPGAQTYTLNFYNDQGFSVGSRSTKADETNFSLDSAELGLGRLFSWDVNALRDGRIACTTPRVSVVRDEQPITPTPPPPPTAMTATWACTGLYQFTVSYSNVPTGNSVQISFIGPMSGGTFPVPPNSQAFIGPGPFTVSSGSVTAIPSGIVVNLPGALAC